MRRGFFGQLVRRLGNALRPGVVVTRAPDTIVEAWDVPVQMRDGITLRVNIFRPQTEARVPALLSAHPYRKDDLPRRTGRPPFQYRLFPQPGLVAFSDLTSWEAPDPAYWVPRGYAVVNCDLRGGGTSEGLADLFSAEEGEDYGELITWTSRQPWCNGKVGLDGVSYLAISQYGAAARRPEGLAAICPWEGVSDLYRDFAYTGGVREDGFSVIWSQGTARAARVRGDLRAEILAHPERDDWWQARTPRLEDIKVPMLVCGSFSDHHLHTRGSFEAFRRAGSAQRWLYTHRGGKWSTYYSPDAAEVRRAFFDHFLRGEDNGWDRRPPVRLAVHDVGPEPAAVTDEPGWPPPDLTWTRLYLDGAALSPVPPAVPTVTPFATRGSGLSFTWVIEEDLDLIGPMSARITVAGQDVSDLHLFLVVRKFRAGQEQYLEGSFGFDGDAVTKGWQRAAHRELDLELSRPEQPVHTHLRAEPLHPGEPVAVDVALRPHATRFRRGDVLRLDLSGVWPYPVDPIRGAFPSRYAPSPEGTGVLHTGGGAEGWLWLGHRPVRD